jgi:hypothetical protein
MIIYKPSLMATASQKWDETERTYIRAALLTGAGPIAAREIAKYWRSKTLSEFRHEVARLIGVALEGVRVE